MVVVGGDREKRGGKKKAATAAAATGREDQTVDIQLTREVGDGWGKVKAVGKKERRNSTVRRFDGSTARSLTVKRFKRFNSSTAQRFGRGLEEMGKKGDRKKGNT